MLKVKDIMTRAVESLNPNNTLQDAIAKMKGMYVGLLPVCDEKKLIGTITAHDIAVQMLIGGDNIKSKTKIHTVMNTNFEFCFENERVDDVKEYMEKNEFLHLPVVNKNNVFEGMISMTDLLQYEENFKFALKIK